MDEETKPVEQREEAEEPSAALVTGVSQALESGDRAGARALVVDLRPRDLADLIALLAPDERVALIQALGTDFDVETFSELDESVRDQLSEALPNKVLAEAVTRLDTDDAAYLLANLEKHDREEILAQLPRLERAAVERNLEYPEETAGRLMQADFVAVAPYWTVGQVIDHMRETDDLPDTFSEIFVVDPAHRVLGSVDLSRMLRTKRDVPVEQIMNTERHQVKATEDQEEVAREFERYNLMSAPVVDANGRLVGVITVDDIVDVIQEEAEEDMRALAGVGDESLTGSVIETLRSRVPWLVVNLGTALIAAAVIRQFGATIEQMVVLAALMPIVASMGGNAATQTMTVTVRALATNKIGPVNATRVITREALVGLGNGLILSFIVAGVVFVWFGSGMLGAVIAAALIINLVVAGLAGILIPLLLDHFEFDPAPASGVFVTMMTDVVGFVAFLGLAKLWLVG